MSILLLTVYAGRDSCLQMCDLRPFCVWEAYFHRARHLVKEIIEVKTDILYATHSLNFYNWWCTPLPVECKNCYMFAMREQFGRQPKNLEWRESAVNEYHKLKAGDVVFVNSMSDTYHEKAEIEWIQRIHMLIACKPGVTFLLLTKRPERALLLADWAVVWPDNLWLGVSVGIRATLDRIDTLAAIPVEHKFLSIEPLLENLMPDILDHPLGKIEWMIVGGESGAERRPFYKQWARELRDLCTKSDIHFTFKQGANRFPGRDNDLDGVFHLDTPFNESEKLVIPKQMSLFDE